MSMPVTTASHHAAQLEPLRLNAGGSRLRRWAFTAGGLVSVVVAFVGVFLPGIPTTGPLLLASFLLAKGNPALQRQLHRCGFFRRYFEYLDGAVEMPMKARCWAAGWMWASITVSSAFLLSTGTGGWILVGGCVVAGLIGSVVIFRFRRSAAAVATERAASDETEMAWEEAECLREAEAIVQMLHGNRVADRSQQRAIRV